MSAECLVRIKVGSIISQDHGRGKWPECKPPKSEWGDHDHWVTKYPNAIFKAEKMHNYWDCRRVGYGVLGEDRYGNGSIFVSDMDGVELLTPMHIKCVLELP